MRKALKKAATAFAILTLFLTGCNPMTRDAAENGTSSIAWSNFCQKVENVSPNALPEHMKLAISDTLSLDADIIISKQLDQYELPSIVLKNHCFEKQDVVLSKIWELAGHGEHYETQQRVTDDLLENGEPVTALTAVTDDDEFYQVRTTYLLAYTKIGMVYQNWWIVPYTEQESSGNYIEKLTGDDDLDFATRDEIQNIAINTMRQLDIEVPFHPVVHSCTPERLQDISKDIKKQYLDTDGLLEFEDGITKNESYIVELHEEYEGTEFYPYIMSNSVVNTTNSFGGSKCYIIYTADGVQAMEIFNLYDFQIEEEIQKILPLEDILEIYKLRHHSRIQAAENQEKQSETIIKIQLYYLPVYSGKDLQYVAKPIWYILSDWNNDGSSERISVVYDAVTGKELE